MKRTIHVLSFLFLFSSQIFSQNSFPGCPGYFAVTNPEGGGASTLSQVNPLTVSLTSIANTGIELNGLAFNPVDQFLYAMSDPLVSGVPQLYRINNAGVPTLLTSINPPVGTVGAVASFVGDIDQNGIYYFPAVRLVSLIPISFEFMLGKLDLNLPLAGMPSVTPTYQIISMDPLCQAHINTYIGGFITALLTGGPLPSGGIQDWAFNPNDNQLWSYLGVEGAIFKLNTVTNTAVCYPTLNPTLTEFGGIFFDQAGLMYGFEVDAGATWKVDISTCPGVGCASLTPGATFAINSRGDAASCPWPDVPLEIELVDFTANAKDLQVELNWVTATENLSSHFIVERSFDGLIFEELGTVQAVGESTSTQQYDFSDREPIQGENYYRLMMVDQNGDKYESSIRAVEFKYNMASSVILFPNPTRNQVSLIFETEASEDVLIEIFNTNGQVLLTHNEVAPGSRIDVALEGLPGGTYFLRLYGNEDMQVMKFHVIE